MNQIISVEGMSCRHCKEAVEKAVTALEGVESAVVDLEKKEVAVTYDLSVISLDAIQTAIENQGYDVSNV